MVLRLILRCQVALWNCRICRCPILAKPAKRPSALAITLGTPSAWGAIVTVMIMLLLLLFLLLGVYHYDYFYKPAMGDSVQAKPHVR